MSMANRLRPTRTAQHSTDSLLAHYAERSQGHRTTDQAHATVNDSFATATQVGNVPVAPRTYLSPAEQHEYLALHYDSVEAHETHGGCVLEIDTSFALADSRSTHPRGLRPLLRGDAQALSMLPKRLAQLCADEALADDVSLEDILFFDTETTGLARAAGTLAFMVGCGHFESTRNEVGTVSWHFRCVQWLITCPSAEPRQLDLFADQLRRSKLLVTFNGRTFDVPLMLSRGIMNRSRLPLGLPHADILPACRAVWRSQFPSCALSALEHTVLGHQRESDVHGAAIPALWHEFTRGFSTAEMVQVLDHNIQDILTTAALSLKLADVAFGDEEDRDAHADLSDDAQRLDVATWLWRRGCGARADSLWSAVARNGAKPHHAMKASRLLVAAHRKDRAATDSVLPNVHLAVWERHGTRALESGYRAAWHMERVDKNPVGARALCQRVLEQLRMEQSLSREITELDRLVSDDPWETRIRKLLAQIEKAEARRKA